MIDGVLLPVLGLGFVLGLRHALDPDHVVAVSTIVGDHRSFTKSSLVGAFWGLGHAASLLLVGILIIVLKLRIPETIALWMELAVALMLVVLGLKAVLKPFRGWKMHIHRHKHDGTSHIHVHMHRPGEEQAHHHRHLMGFGARPFFVGMVHGMAGSAALMILVLATIPTAVAGLIYIAVFGLGSVGGMLLMSSLISLPFVFAQKSFRLLGEAMQLIVGLSSVAFGVFMVWQIGPQQI